MISLIRSSFVLTSPDNTHCPVSDRPEFVFIGRSNVGKSSLINTLCAKKEFAKTSAKPGKTQLINYFSVETADSNDQHQQRYLVDLPGYGYARSSRNQRHEWALMIQEYLLKRESITHIFVLIDSRHLPQAIDLDFVDWLSKTGRTYTLVFTKSDKTKAKELSTNVKAFIVAVSKIITVLPGYYITSALNPLSIQEILTEIHQLCEK